MDVNDCLVSIIVPVYNVERYIAQCITSILAQTYQKFELILVDDGSKDKSGEICDFYAKQDKRILVFHNANQGVSAARNFGIEHASGSRLCFVDSDDWVDTTYLSDMLKYADYDFVIQGMKHLGQECRYKDESFVNNKDLFKKYIENAQRHDILFNGPCSKLFKTEIVNTHKLRYDERISNGEDLLFNLSYMCYIKTTYIASTISYNYRVTEGSLTHRHIPIENTLKKSNIIKNQAAYLSKIIKNQKIYEVLIADLIEKMLRNGYREDLPKNDRFIAFSFFQNNGNFHNVKYMRIPYSGFIVFLHMPFFLVDPILRFIFKIMNIIRPVKKIMFECC